MQSTHYEVFMILKKKKITLLTLLTLQSLDKSALRRSTKLLMNEL